MYLAMIITLPISLFMTIYLTEYAHRRIRKYVYPLLDILAGLPSVIYGVWGSLLIVPILIRSMDEVAKTIPQEILDSSYSLGAARR